MKHMEENRQKNYTPLAVLPRNSEKQVVNDIVTTPEEVKSDALAYITKKQEYNRFRAMCKAGKVTNAIVSSKALGVDRRKIIEWMKTPAILKAMQEATNKYIENIEVSKDWKAHQYLLERTLQEDEQKQQTGVTNQILIVNKEGEFRIEKGVK